jgi:hypothetical protein
MVSPEQKIRIIKYARFIFGLLIFAWLFSVMPMLSGNDFLTTVMFYFLTPLALFAIPMILIGVYFLVTAKIRPRLDIIILIILFICLFGLMRGAIGENIGGSAELKVTVVQKNGTPVVGVEVDVAKETGPPPEGGFKNTNDEGIADFEIEPGDYVIYFNMNNFPQELIVPEPVPINITGDNPILKTIILETKE